MLVTAFAALYAIGAVLIGWLPMTAIMALALLFSVDVMLAVSLMFGPDQ